MAPAVIMGARGNHLFQELVAADVVRVAVGVENGCHREVLFLEKMPNELRLQPGVNNQSLFLTRLPDHVGIFLEGL